MTLSEIAAEYRSLAMIHAEAERAAFDGNALTDMAPFLALGSAVGNLRRFEHQHFPRLLRIAEAAAALDFDDAVCDGEWTEGINAYRYDFPKDPINRLRAALEEDTNA